MKNLLIAFIIVLALCAPRAMAADNMPPPMNFGPRDSLTIVSADKQHVFSVEVANTDAERSRGMMFRDVLPVGEGMLFDFEVRQITSIWMKNTSVFLDILFIREDGRIVKIEHSAKPYSLRSMSSEVPVIAVLELAGGQVNARGIKPGDIVSHSLFHPKS